MLPQSSVFTPKKVICSSETPLPTCQTSWCYYVCGVLSDDLSTLTAERPWFMNMYKYGVLVLL